MKKIVVALLFSLISSYCIFAQSYKIDDYSFNITASKGLNIGKTSESALLMKYPIDTKTIFHTKEDLEKYIDNYEQQLLNTRAFETVELNYNVQPDEANNLYKIDLVFNLVDSNHLLALPYPKYDSNTGFNLKIKAKDTNFLGTLNPLATDLYLNWKEDVNQWETGFNFNYSYPFKAGIFDASWDNNLNFAYIFGDEAPTFKTRIGVGFILPRDLFSLGFGAYQTIGFAEPSEDAKENYFYFQEHLGLSAPIKLYKAPNFSTVTYTPYADFMFSWDLKNLKENKPMAPIRDGIGLNFGHSISNSNINWENCFRKGYSISLNNDFTYKFNTKLPVPSVSLEGEFFYNFKIMDKSFLDRIGINSRLYAYSVIDIPNRGQNGNFQIGSRMRGILNDKLQSVPYGFVLNLDIPINIITTNFKYDIFNFTMQLSPFVDIALTNDPSPDIKNFNLKNKNLSAGAEILVYPKKFSSYTIRASIGFDIKRAFKESNKLKGLLHNKEIYIGLDLHY